MINANNRVEVNDDEYPVKVLVDGIIVGQGTLTVCKLLADELKASDVKCDAVKRIMEER